MLPRNKFRQAAALVLLALGCQRTAEPRHNAGEQDPIVAFVAASTREAVKDVAASFTLETSIRVQINADDSGKLALQIAQGAPADLFLSANEKWAAYLGDKGFVQETKLLLGNTLVIVVPRGNPAKIHRPEDLAGPEIKRVALAGPTVPAGTYARQALKKLKLWDTLENGKKIISGENVRFALAYVERGDCEAGIVYGTDARVAGHVEMVCTFDPEAHEPIRYPLVLLKGGANQDAARMFFAFLQTPAAATRFRNHGFTLLDGP